MRVVAGELRGRRLASPPAAARIRPTSDRVREALFSILGDLSGANVLDLFCGTGALAIEALSRGAAEATLVDTDIRLARRNVRTLDLDDRCELVRGDALRFLRGAQRRYDLAFCDPPYKLADRLGPPLSELLAERLAEDARVIVESATRAPLSLELPLIVERRYGDTLIRVYS